MLMVHVGIIIIVVVVVLIIIIIIHYLFVPTTGRWCENLCIILGRGNVREWEWDDPSFLPSGKLT